MSLFFGVPAQLKALRDNLTTLLTRWSQTKADFLDAAITSRAPSSTALSTVQWTNTRAANLDLVPTVNTAVADLQAYGAIDAVVGASVASGGTISAWQTAFDSIGGIVSVNTVIAAAGYTQSLLVTGKGCLEFLALSVPSALAGSYGYRLTIDGVVVHAVTNQFGAGQNGAGAVVCGAVMLNGTTPAGVSLGSWPFNSSLKVEVYATATTGTVRTYSKHRRTT